MGLQETTIEFLANAGLPDAAAPYLSFAKDTTGQYDSIGKLTQLYDYLEDDFDRFVFIGSDGAGNPITIDTSSGDKVVCLDHEDNFYARYMNSSVMALGETLIAYHDFISNILAENGEDAFMDANFTDSQFEDLTNRISKTDIRALMPDSFWEEDLETLLVNRKYYLSQNEF